MVDTDTVEVLEFGQKTYAFDDIDLDLQLPKLTKGSILGGINYKVSGDRLSSL